MKNQCLIFFGLFRPSFGAGLIRGRFSAPLSLYTNDTQRICSNMRFTLKPDNVLPINQSSISLSTDDKDPGPPPPPTNFKPHINISFFLSDDIMYTSKRFSIDIDVYQLADSDNENVCDFNAKSAGMTASSRSITRMCTSRRASGSSAPADCLRQAHCVHGELHPAAVQGTW